MVKTKKSSKTIHMKVEAELKSDTMFTIAVTPKD